MPKPFQGALFFPLSMFACKENVKFLYFEFMKWAIQMKRPLKKKQNEILHDALSLKAAELEVVRHDSKR